MISVYNYVVNSAVDKQDVSPGHACKEALEE